MLFESQIKHYQGYTDRYVAFKVDLRKELSYTTFYADGKNMPAAAAIIAMASVGVKDFEAAMASFGKAMTNLGKLGFFIFLFSFSARGQSLFRTIVQDDKFWHHQTSAMLSGAGSIISFKIWEAPVRNVTFTIGSNIALGAGKEVWDGMGHGVMDWKGDFPMDIVGSVTGGFFGGMAIRLKYHRDDLIDEAKYDMTAATYDERVKAVITYETTINPVDSGSEQ